MGLIINRQTRLSLAKVLDDIKGVKRP